MSTLTPLSISQIHSANAGGDSFTLFGDVALGQVYTLAQVGVVTLIIFHVPHSYASCVLLHNVLIVMFHLYLHSHQVSLIGIIRDVEQKATKTSYTIEDHTGMSGCFDINTTLHAPKKYLFCLYYENTE